MTKKFRCSGTYYNKICSNYYTVYTEIVENKIFESIKQKLNEFKKFHNNQKAI